MLHAMAITHTTIARLLVTEAVVAVIILLLFIIIKPRKPSTPQHPLPSLEPPHLMRRKSRRIEDKGAMRIT